MDNPEKLTLLGTQDTGRRQTKQKNNKENFKKKNEQQQNVGHHYTQT